MKLQFLKHFALRRSETCQFFADIPQLFAGSIIQTSHTRSFLTTVAIVTSVNYAITEAAVQSGLSPKIWRFDEEFVKWPANATIPSFVHVTVQISIDDT